MTATSAAPVTAPPRVSGPAAPAGPGVAGGPRLLLRVLALGWLAAVLLLPVLMTGYRTFEHGLGPVLDALTTPDAVHAAKLTLIAVLIAVPANTVFGVITALLIVRQRVPGRTLLSALLDLPFAVSPIVLGLALFVLYGQQGWFGPWLSDHGYQVIFSLPGIVLATMFVSIPFVVNELVPVLEEIGTDQEEAATTLGATMAQTFRRITLPSMRWGLAYGVVLTTARALGEFGAVSVVSGNLLGQTQTLPLYVEDRFQNFDLTGAYAASMLLALIAIAVLITMTRLSRQSGRDHVHQEDQ
jgi:sulfate/thiosulfate transport system permease protein